MHAGYLRLQTPTQNINIYCFSNATIVARNQLDVTLYIQYIACCVFVVFCLQTPHRYQTVTNAFIHSLQKPTNALFEHKA